MQELKATAAQIAVKPLVKSSSVNPGTCVQVYSTTSLNVKGFERRQKFHAKSASLMFSRMPLSATTMTVALTNLVGSVVGRSCLLRMA